MGKYLIGKYFTKDNEKLIVYKEIRNGVLLAPYTDGGFPIVNEHGLLYVTREELDSEWKEFNFELKTEEKTILKNTRILREIAKIFKERTIDEWEWVQFHEYEDSVPENVYNKIAKAKTARDAYNSLANLDNFYDMDVDTDAVENIVEFLFLVNQIIVSEESRNG